MHPDAVEPSLAGIVAMAFQRSAGRTVGLCLSGVLSRGVFSSSDQLSRYQESKDYIAETQPGGRYYFVAAGPQSQLGTEAPAVDSGQRRGRGSDHCGDQCLVGCRFTPQPMDKTDGGIHIVPGTPNFSAVSDTQMYFSIPIALRAFGAHHESRFHAKARFETGPAIRLVLEQGHLDCAPIPHPALYMPLYEGLLAAYRLTDEYKALAQAWQRSSRLKSRRNSEASFTLVYAAYLDSSGSVGADCGRCAGAGAHAC